MKNLNEAWDQLKKVNDTIEYQLSGYPIETGYGVISNVVLIERANEAGFRLFLANYCIEHANDLANPKVHLFIQKTDTGFRFATRFIGTYEEAEKQDNLLKLKDVCGNVDWSELQEQKKMLCEIQATLNAEDDDISARASDAIEGILGFMDHIQDFAVDKAGLSEELVFPGLGEDEEDDWEERTNCLNLVYTSDSYQVTHIGFNNNRPIGSIKYGDDFRDRLYNLLCEESDVDILTVNYVKKEDIGYEIGITCEEENKPVKEYYKITPTTIY